VICPSCQGETNVIDSRAYSGSVRRRRECIKCEQRFTTFEVVSTGLGGHPNHLIILDKRTFSDQIRSMFELTLNEVLLKSRPIFPDSQSEESSAQTKKPTGEGEP